MENKMTPKEMLERVKILKHSTACCICKYYKNGNCEDKKSCFWKDLEQALTEHEKQTQILEVLKNKRVDIYDFNKIVSKNCDNLTKLFLYNEKRRIESKLTACEYKLIKEWLK